MKSALILFALAAISLVVSVRANSLDSSFANPPDQTKPRCYWYWMDGQISKEGITRDMEAMKRVGIGEGYIGIIEGGDQVKALSEEWWQLIEHAVRDMLPRNRLARQLIKRLKVYAGTEHPHSAQQPQALAV